MPIEFIPESSLLNNIYVPNYSEPELIAKQLNSLDTEVDINGVRSIIKLSKDDQYFSPFIDMSKFDIDSKDWYWYTYTSFNSPTTGFIPYKINISGNVVTFNSVLGYRDDLDLGGYSSFSKSTVYNFKFDINKRVIYFPSSRADFQIVSKFQYRPIIITINGQPLTDLTDYGNLTTDIALSPIDSSKTEFYYNFEDKLYTNQNLDGLDPDSVTIYYYQNLQTISVKTRIRSNTGRSSYYTPTIDYFIVKLNGQYLKGK